MHEKNSFIRLTIIFTILTILITLNYELKNSPNSYGKQGAPKIIIKETSGNEPDTPPVRLNLNRDYDNKTIYYPVLSKKFTTTHRKRYLVLYHFRFCNIMDGSTFDSAAHIYELNGTIAVKNPYINQTAAIVDRAAKKLYDMIIEKSTGQYINEWDIIRYSCYTAAVGTSPLVNVSKTTFLRNINTVYFKDVIPGLFRAKPLPTPLPVYQLAYVIFVNDNNAFNNLKALVNTLNDGKSIFLIQFDEKCDKLIGNPVVISWTRRVGNVYISKTKGNDRWGPASTLFLQLDGFFELAKLAKWDYVIQLYCYDYPTRHNTQIYEYLNDPVRNGSIWLETTYDTANILKRISSPLFRTTVWLNNGFKRIKPLPDYTRLWNYNNWTPCKNSLWGIYPRDFIEMLKSDQTIINSLGFFEHSEMPEEIFYCTIINNNPFWKSNIIGNSKKLQKWEKGGGAKWLTSNDIFELEGFTLDKEYDKPKYFFVSNVDVMSEIALKQWIKHNHLGIE